MHKLYTFSLEFSCVPDFGSTFSGVLTDEYGRVQALWGSFSTQVCSLHFSFSLFLYFKVDNKFIDHRKLRNLGKKRGKSKKRETNSKKDLEESEGTQADKGKKETPPKSLGKELTRPTAERVRKVSHESTVGWNRLNLNEPKSQSDISNDSSQD